MRLAKITTPTGWSYRFTLEDWLWACRMLAGEVSDGRWGPAQVAEGEAVLWTMLNYFYQMRGKSFGRGEAHTVPPHTYARTIRAYSQPINPCWARGGACAAGSDETKLNRRARISALTPDQMDPLLKDTVTRFMEGKVSGTPYFGVVHFAAKYVSYSDDPTHVGPVDVGLSGNANVFYKSNLSVRWTTSDIIKMHSTYMTAVTVVVLLAGGVVAFYLWRKRKGQR